PREEAMVPLRLAWETSRQLGARPLLAEIEVLARRARIELTPEPAIADAAGTARLEAPADRLGLTRRERAGLVLVADGRTNRQIAGALFISDKTASVHVSNILSKLGVTNRAEAAVAAHNFGLSS